MDRISPFTSVAQESAGNIATDLAFLGVFIAACGIVGGIRSRRDAKKRAEKAAADHEALVAKIKDANEKRLNAYRKYYGITPKEIPVGAFRSTKETYDAMIKDLTQWARQITTSKTFQENMQKVCDAHNSGTVDKDADPLWFCEYDYPGRKITPQMIASWIKVSEGVNGWKETIEISDGSQEERLFVAPIIGDLMEMARIRYSNYLTYIDNGDGDEGTLYYAFKTAK